MVPQPERNTNTRHAKALSQLGKVAKTPTKDYTREDARVLKAHMSTDAAHELGICMRANVLLHIAGFPDALYLVDMAKACNINAEQILASVFVFALRGLYRVGVKKPEAVPESPVQLSQGKKKESYTALLKKCAGELKHASNDRAIHMLANLVAEDVLTGGVPGAVVYDDDKLDQGNLFGFSPLVLVNNPTHALTQKYGAPLVCSAPAVIEGKTAWGAIVELLVSSKKITQNALNKLIVTKEQNEDEVQRLIAAGTAPADAELARMQAARTYFKKVEEDDSSDEDDLPFVETAMTDEEGTS